MSAYDFVSLASKNERKSKFLVLVLLAFFFFLGAFIDGSIREETPSFTTALLTVALIRAITAYFKGDKKLLKLVGARPVNPQNYMEKCSLT